MPVFNASDTPTNAAIQEAARTLGGQVKSLTFIERRVTDADDRLKPIESPIGHLLTAASNSLLLAGHTTRLTPRFAIGADWEYQDPTIRSGGQGELALFYNPTIPLHNELTRPPLRKSQYHITSIMAPPFMCASTGIYDHIGAGEVALAMEGQSRMSVTMLDQYGALPLPVALYQSQGELTRVNNIYVLEFVPVPGLPAGYNEQLVIGREQATRTELKWKNRPSGSAQALRIATEATGDYIAGDFALSPVTGGVDLSEVDNIGHNIMALLHFPGAYGGYLVSRNLSAANFAEEVKLTQNLSAGGPAPDASLAERIIRQARPIIYLAIYATDDILFPGSA